MLYFSLWKRVLIWLVIVVGIVLALPNILPRALLQKLPQSYASLHLPLGIDLQGGSRLVMQLPLDAREKRDETMDVMKRRLDQSGRDFVDYSVEKQGRRNIRVEVPGLFDVQLLKDIVSISARVGVYEEVDAIAASDVITGKVLSPEGAEVVYSYDDPPIGYLVHSKPIIPGEDLVGAFALLDKNGQDVSVHATLNNDAQKRLTEFVKRAPGKRLVVVLDGEVLRLQPVLDEVNLGYFVIGPLEPDFADNLATVISTGPLPVDVTFIEERTIGSDLGVDYAASGLKAAIGALVVVALFMIVSYGLLGIVADIALAVNLALVVTILTFVGVPLSLAGFAGLVLTISVSVDAIILIFERIREDRRNGRSVTQALDAGFSRARATIVDANITTLIAALVLFLLGVGPIHGFALTVTVGIFVSLFTTLTFTRLMISTWVRYFRPGEVPARLLRLVPINTRIAFMQLRKIALGFAIIITVVTAALYVTVGVNYGIDFAGGSLAVLEAKNNEANTADIAMRVGELNIGEVVITSTDNPARVFLTIPSQQMGEDADQSVAVKLRGEFEQDYRLERMDVVGPTVSNDLSQASIIAVILSLASIFGYVMLRFNWKFAVGAVLATVHDIVVLSFIFIFLQWQFNLWSIAAVLAIIGYSLNDTIVVYDRIRELLQRGGQITMASLVDLAINRTLSRTILTSLAAVVAHIPLYYFGGSDMRDFASVLLWGIIIGTYSSIFIAGPLLVFLGVRPKADNGIEPEAVIAG